LEIKLKKLFLTDLDKTFLRSDTKFCISMIKINEISLMGYNLKRRAIIISFIESKASILGFFLVAFSSK